MIDFESKTGLSRANIIANIQDHVRAATVAQIAQGATWYQEARDLAHVMVGEYCKTVEHAAWVIAAMSPRMFWSQNVKAALHFAKTGERLDGLMTRSYETAKRQIDMDTVDFDTLAKSGKTPAFAKNIAGDDMAVAVDVWAARAAGINEKALNRVGVYNAVADCYAEVAIQYGIAPSQCQAIAWIVARNGRAK